MESDSPATSQPMKLIVAFAALLLSCGFMGSSFAAGRQPNVLFILADDLGWSDTTLFGTTKFYQNPT